MAIKGLNTLIKLHKRRVDVLRREMNALEEERRQLVHLAEMLRKELAEEAKRAGTDPQLGRFFGNYAKRMHERQEGIAREVARIDGEIEEKILAIREEFSEQKKYEIAQENDKKREAARGRQMQQQRLDEIAAQQFFRREGDPNA